MRNYSRSQRDLKGWGVALLPVWAVLGLSACATPRPTVETSGPAPVEEPLPEPPPPVAEPVQQTVATRADAPLTYTVKKGDTLWGIANRFLLDPWQWPEVWYVNDQIRNPHKIYPGDQLRLVYVDGRPILQTADGRMTGSGMTRMSPQIREQPLEDSIPVIPIEAIRDFLRGPRLVTSQELNASPYLLAFEGRHIVGGAGFNFYVQDLEAGPNFTYSVVRRGQEYRDPDDGRLLGYEAVPVGDAEIREYGQPSSAVMARSSREALIGDRLLPSEAEAFSANFLPRAPEQPVDGSIIAVTDGVSQIGQYYIVTLNRGANHGLEPGHVLDILQAGERAIDPYTGRSVKLPESYAGKLLVFKVTPEVSFGLVMSIVRPVHALDRVASPVPGRS